MIAAMKRRPDADITVPELIKITNFTNEADKVTIDFSPNSTDNYDTSAFVLETSPTLGPSANWMADPNVF